ncbi:uncharacterized protein LOC131532156 [Onychostoma macrolepis]|uniref:uncharacterized protein LOC131532156 n=1 Tax=Onychostoma macrolepis TaxID=369639 RepID=UPI00272D7E82|nr:uncharacterized protein LOC131532156 [Onychostoma macrolepis]
MNQQPHLYSTDDSKVSFLCSLLTGKALDWATAIWEGRRMTFPSYANFLRQFRDVFEHSAGGKEPGEHLLSLHQGKDTAAEYTLTFRTLAAQTGWEEDPLKLLYRKGLTADLQSELACRDEGKTLEQFMETAIRIDNLMRARRGAYSTRPSVSPSFSSDPEPMQIGLTRLHPEEREREKNPEPSLLVLWTTWTPPRFLSHQTSSPKSCFGEFFTFWGIFENNCLFKD